MPTTMENDRNLLVAANSNNAAAIMHKHGNLREAKRMYNDAIHTVSQILSDRQERLPQHDEDQPDAEDNVEVPLPFLLPISEDKLNDPIHLQLKNLHKVKKALASTTLVILYNMGLLKKKRGDVQNAIQHFEFAIKIIEEEGLRSVLDVSFVMAVYYHLGTIAFEEGNDAEALLYLVDALCAGKGSQCRNRFLTARILNKVGGLLLSYGRVNDAIQVFNQSLRLYNNYESSRTFLPEEEDEVVQLSLIHI